MSYSERRRQRSLLTLLALGSLLSVVFFTTDTALAHGGSLRASQQELSVPTWLFLMTGGGAIGASFLLASFVTDRRFVRDIHTTHRLLGVAVPHVAVVAVNAVGVLSLLSILVVGFAGPVDPLLNLAVLLVWGGWWAGYSMTTYLVGNTWPALNPWRTVAEALPSLGIDYPARLGAWPSVVGLLGLIWLEVVSPLADNPRLLAAVVLAYSVVTLSGAVVFGSAWFDHVDPVARVFRYYGRVAPMTRTDSGVRLRLPGSALTETSVVDGFDEVAFVIALLWVTTYDGLVATPLWRGVATPIVDSGLPAVVLYPLALFVGFGIFLLAYRMAARYGKRYAESYLTVGTIARRFAPSLLPIAVGYHLAHYLGYFFQLLPMLLRTLVSPLSPPSPEYLVLTAWFGGLELAFVLVGHVLAIWVAHAIAYDLFPGRLQAIESQYSITAVMVLYTVVSLYIVSQPVVDPPYL